MSLSAIRERIAVDAVRIAPKNLYSEIVGWAARRNVPAAVRAPLYSLFARGVGANLSEVELPLADYPSFASFFARRLKQGARAIAGGPDVVVMPCDGRLGASGRALRGRMIQAKGHDYALAELLADGELATRLENGAYVTIYLSPSDYHRVHSPCDGELVGFDYVPGARFPVSARFVEGVPHLFARNERLVLRLRGARGELALVMVGAAGVGNMTIPTMGVETRQLRRRRVHRVRLDRPHRVARGDELACFELGSTVVAVFSAAYTVTAGTPGTKVRLGTAMAGRSAGRNEDAAA